MSGSTLVSTAELAGRLGEWRLFDCRHDLMKPDLGENQYRESHIPGALFAHLERDLSAPKNGRNGRHPLPDPEKFARTLGHWGLKASDQVVCYDGGNGMFASRLWWMLRWVGHTSVAVLDGGFAKWTKEGRPVTSEVPQFASTPFSPHLQPMAVDVATVEKNLGKMTLLDARAAPRYRGEIEPIDPEPGHIPGALNRQSLDNVNADGTFKPAHEIRQGFAATLGTRRSSEVVNYCGSGVSACHNLLAMEIAGLTGGKLYAGSWSEWIADPSRPREKS
jgi:thiosulfate/3-mercaptopyruvate sulfurtransferase